MNENLQDTVGVGDTSPITVYSKPGCQACRLTELALGRAGVSFEVVDLSQRPDIVDQLRAQGLMSAPVVEAPDGSRTAGYDPDRVKALVRMVSPSSRPAAPASLTRPEQVHAPVQPQSRGRGL